MISISDTNKLSKQKQSVETLRWREGRLEMIDQRVLPMQFEYLAYTNAKEVAEGIRSMVVRGAPAIGCAAAYGVALEALALQHQTTDSFNQAMEQGFELLAQSRPTAVNLFWALQRMRACWDFVCATSADRYGFAGRSTSSVRRRRSY